ncbi:MAG: hypothetical protein M0R74_02000 [Dehalococcoidia bacterium]|nr:hypothetical protein [Dehalococcoidia bacterium]
METYHFGSITRLAPLATQPFTVQPLGRDAWRTGDFVAGEVVGESRVYHLERVDGRLQELVPGDYVIGALGDRRATLALVGDWRSIGDDGQMHALNAAGVFGRCTSRSVFEPAPMPLVYRGHVHLDGRPARMRDWAKSSSTPFRLPVIQVIGTSMECGKTTAAKSLIRRLSKLGVQVGGMKLTGVGRYRDVLGMLDAGAKAIVDFVDVGLPSSLEEPQAFASSVDEMLQLMAHQDVDLVVAELGASPMEPYNGTVAMEKLAPHVRLTLLAASDMYATLGAIHYLDIRPDLIVGRVASTAAGIEIGRQITGLPTLNPVDPAAADQFDALLRDVFPRELAGRLEKPE